MWSGALRLRPIKRSSESRNPSVWRERQAEDDPQRQRGPDREVRVPPLASAKTVLRWYPRGNCILAQPDRDVARGSLRPRSYSLQFRILYFFLYWQLTRLDFAATMTLPPRSL